VRKSRLWKTALLHIPEYLSADGGDSQVNDAIIHLNI